MIKERLKESQEKRELNTPDKKEVGIFHRLANWLNEWHVTRILQALTAIFLIPTVGFMAFDYAMKLEERKARAWQLITTKASGNSGKIWAIEHLNNLGESLDGIDLSPRNGGNGEYLVGLQLESAYLANADLFKANLRRANLRETELRAAKLREVNLFNADLFKANLRMAELREANLRKVNLRKANLNWADLFKANLRKADLRNADLRMSDLFKANLKWADLISADLVGANLTNANLEKSILYGAKGLTCPQLTKARNWQLSYRGFEHACGAPVRF